MADKDNRKRFFDESCLLADIKPDIVLKLFFLTMSNADIDFHTQDLQFSSYTTENILPTTRRVKLIGKKEFAAAAPNLEHKALIVHIVGLSVNANDEVHLLKKDQLAHPKANETSIKVSSKYADFADIFSPKLAIELPEYTEINDHDIKLVDDRQFLYGLIYSLGLVKLEILKTYVKNNLANGFIKSSKSSAKLPILF